MTESKKLKIEFAPGCFDQFEGSQEELDVFVREIQEMFENITPEELEARSQPLDIDTLLDEGETEDLEMLMKLLTGDGQRKLQ